MNNKNAVAAALALMAMAGFLAVFTFFAFGKVPPENKEFINQALIALIGFCGTAFGYYLGSSLSSAQKNDLLAQATVPQFIGIDPAGAGQDRTVAAIVTKEAGFATLYATTLGSLFFGIVIFASLLTMSGCATMQKESPQITAGKSLLAVKGTIVTAATTTDRLCKLQQMPADNCMQAKAAYELAKPAYDSAVDAYLLMSTGGDPAAFGAAITRVQSIADSMLQLTDPNNGHKGGAK